MGNNDNKKTARSAAFAVLSRVEAGDAYADILLERELRGMDTRECALTTELVYGVLRWRIKIDWIIDYFSKIKVKKLEHSVLTAMRLGVYQLLFLSKIPVQAAINESVELVKSGGGKGGQAAKKAGFVNAVLRSVDSARNAITFPHLKSQPVKYVSVVFSHPEWLVGRWIKRYGIKEAIELCQAGQCVPPMTLRVNTLAQDRATLLRDLGRAGIGGGASQFSPAGISLDASGRSALGALGFEDRRFYIQDEASQLVVQLLGPKPGDVVLDACAAPGGKTTHMAELMENQGIIYAVDMHAGRLKIIERLVQRLGATIIKTIKADAALMALQPALAGLPEGAIDAMPQEGFDAILVDAPCSGLGVLRRTPDIKYRRSEGGLSALAFKQRSILDNVSKFLKPEGTLVYSVCSFEPEETTDVIEGFLKANPDFTLDRDTPQLPESCRGFFDSLGYFRSYPHRGGLDGFFAARLKKG